jgi:hypothetical protein
MLPDENPEENVAGYTGIRPPNHCDRYFVEPPRERCPPLRAASLAFSGLSAKLSEAPDSGSWNRQTSLGLASVAAKGGYDARWQLSD